VPDLGGGKAVVGLRQRKKQQTRTKLIEAAIDLSERQGFEQTTVEQIVESANVSARTFTRYFTTKAGVILALLHDLTEAVNAELTLVPLDVNPLTALLAANIGMLGRAEDNVGPMTSDRIVALLRMVNTSPTLQRLAIDFRTQETTEALAKRMRVPVNDPTVRLTSAVWAAVIATAWGDLGGRLPIDHWELDNVPGAMHQSLVDTFENLIQVTTGTGPED
jgi:AcrR family transcriptional regulator